MRIQPGQWTVWDRIKQATSANRNKAVTWFKQQAMALSNVGPAQMWAQNRENLVPVIQRGAMFMFYYDPKLKAKLPYYDRFPLVIPLERYGNGFLGINFHYLPPKLRILLLNRIRDKRMTYRGLKNHKYIRPTIKRYLNTHVRGRYLHVKEEDWDTAIFLPVERFVKASKKTVWSDSKGY